jgi:hypothetical protein
MDNIIGPISAAARDRLADWVTMRAFREDLKFYARDPVKFDLAIKKETELYNTFLSNYAKGVIT